MIRSGLAGVAGLAVLLAACGTPSRPTVTSASAEASPSRVEASTAPRMSGRAAGSATPAASTPATGWRRLAEAVSGVAPREDHTWTVNADGDVAYLFGGRTADGLALGDLWAFDLARDRWSRLEAAGSAPAARFGHNAVWAAGIGLVIFGGQAGTAFFNDLWAYDVDAGRWRRLPARGAVPVARYGSCAAVAPDGRLWISHGFTAENRRFADTRAYDFATGTWSDETPPGEVPVPRCLHGCWWTDDGKFALYAGQTTGTLALDDLWFLTVGAGRSTHQWSAASLGADIAARNLYASTRFGSATLVFGGQALDGSRLADTWLIATDGRASAVSPAGRQPAPRSGAELVADAARGRVLLFGGRDAERAMADLWQLTLDGS
ncbi:MAG TPA: kelch repeat-containing protein [Candidatus Limnocylindria bacterium]|nr:kelch repeat-containing protein [Candidatus Limnocylindria bacterium]